MSSLESGQKNKIQPPTSTKKSEPSPAPEPEEDDGGSNIWIWIIVGFFVFIVVAGLIIGIIIWLVSDSGSCNNNADCGQGQICVNNSCVDGCSSNSDCDDNAFCINSTCVSVTSCTSQSDCSSSQKCIFGPAGAMGVCAFKCKANSDCPSNNTCNSDQGICIPNCQGHDCLCAPGSICTDKTCQSPSSFTSTHGLEFLNRRCTSNLKASTDISGNNNVTASNFLTRTFVSSDSSGSDTIYTYNGLNTAVAWQFTVTGTDSSTDADFPNVRISYVRLSDDEFIRGSNVISTGGSSTFSYCDPGEDRIPMMSNSLYMILRSNDQGEFRETPEAVFISPARNTSLKVTFNRSTNAVSFTKGDYSDVCPSTSS